MSKVKRRPKSIVPKTIMAARVFGPMFKLLNDIDRGEVNEMEGHVVLDRNVAIPEIRDMWLAAPGYIDIWCNAFDLIGHEAGVVMESKHLRSVAETLGQDEPMFDSKTLAAARGELSVMKSMWTKLPDRVIMAGLDKLNIEDRPNG